MGEFRLKLWAVEEEVEEMRWVFLLPFCLPGFT